MGISTHRLRDKFRGLDVELTLQAVGNSNNCHSDHQEVDRVRSDIAVLVVNEVGLVAQSSNHFLLHQNGVTTGTVVALGQTGLGAGCILVVFNNRAVGRIATDNNRIAQLGGIFGNINLVAVEADRMNEIKVNSASLPVAVAPLPLTPLPPRGRKWS